ncbi:unnamed protein product [Prorocentrum cordatum]|uniref:Uncharacterized protein n=1 Tax=Prorocentrum cordatum TaxID=2364126 RepID=A0ABN9XHG7_9DINO|nr:unnamed protein product [Polarella glacialis]
MHALVVAGAAIVGGRVRLGGEARGGLARGRRQLHGAAPARVPAAPELLGPAPAAHPLQRVQVVVPRVAVMGHGVVVGAGGARGGGGGGGRGGGGGGCCCCGGGVVGHPFPTFSQHHALLPVVQVRWAAMEQSYDSLELTSSGVGKKGAWMGATVVVEVSTAGTSSHHANRSSSRGKAQSPVHTTQLGPRWGIVTRPHCPAPRPMNLNVCCST